MSDDGSQEKMNESREDYLEAILRLKLERPEVRSVDIAEFLGFSKPSVSTAMKKLCEGGYIRKSWEGYITLTDKGQAIAEDIYARHLFFAEHLTEIGIDPQTAESEACRIEHVISKETFQRLVEANHNAKEKTITMRTEVRYFTKTGNTKKLAEAIAQVSDCQAQSVPAPIEEYTDVLFLGASVYAGGISEEMKEYIHSLDKKQIGMAAVFSTSALLKCAFPQIRKELEKEGIAVCPQDFYCRGKFTVLYKKRPNARDLESVKRFAADILSQAGKMSGRD